MEGVRCLAAASEDLRVVAAIETLGAALEAVAEHHPVVVLVDKAFGLPAILEWVSELRQRGVRPGIVVWGNGLNEAEALRIVQTGAQGVLRKTTSPVKLLECLRQVASGLTWMEESLLQEHDRPMRSTRSNLTPREHQVVELVEQGMKNKEIGRAMGIRPGTVKIHLKHIFEKTGVRGRYGLALTGLKEKGFLQYPTV